MFDLKDLYQEIIVDHNRAPRNFRAMDDADLMAVGHNPLCGDKLTVYMKVNDGKICDVSFQGDGCAISVASASLMTEELIGKSEGEAEAIFGRFHDLVTDREAEIDFDAVGKLGALAGVREFPTRIKCATLCWHTLQAALKQQQEGRSNDHVSISTE